MAAYAPVPRRTVYQVVLRLTALTYMPQYEDLNNTATLKVTNELVLTVLELQSFDLPSISVTRLITQTRPLFRNCFGEFYFRTVVLEYFMGPVLGDTIASLAFLLEENENNEVDKNNRSYE